MHVVPYHSYPTPLFLNWRHDLNLELQARTLRDVDILSLPVQISDGKAVTIEPQHTLAQFEGPEPSPELENGKTYYGACHCGAVTLAMKTNGPLTDGNQWICECDCSICTRVRCLLRSKPQIPHPI